MGLGRGGGGGVDVAAWSCLWVTMSGCLRAINSRRLVEQSHRVQQGDASSLSAAQTTGTCL